MKCVGHCHGIDYAAISDKAGGVVKSGHGYGILGTPRMADRQEDGKEEAGGGGGRRGCGWVTQKTDGLSDVSIMRLPDHSIEVDLSKKVDWLSYKWNDFFK